MRRLPLMIAVLVTALCALAGILYLRSRPRGVEIVCMAVDGHEIGLGLKDGTAVEISLQDGSFREERRIAHCSGDGMNALSYTSAHELVCSGEKLRTVSRGGALRDLPIPSSLSGGAFGSAAEFRGGLAVITATENILMIDASGGIEKQIGAHTALYGDVKASRDGKFLAASGHTPHVWSLDLLEEREFAHSDYTYGPVAFSDSRLYMGNQDGCVYEWSVGDWKAWPRICMESGTISQVSLSPDGTELAMAGREVVLLSTDTAKLGGRIPRDARGGLGFLDNSKVLTSTGSRVEMWECAAGVCTPKAAINVRP
ncbi:hypothetical protein Acid345_4503 [Candidatus Koribacter versatilis Ellin345]|uniref:WD-40 repeat protein n=1 Tax=Koribacter versatilis (strain Ellin345) TaxID=204669 RepID=Q1IHZ7_KORVE|nr:WD40 repeat domain-containing protein [Candidatus Koribacter versatilis]ABF43503.1 hypothetical protein Acid345_4503 [Candidatus Koribacter versatilis Ellin345]